MCGLGFGLEELSGEVKPEPRAGGTANECSDEAHTGFSGAEFGCEFSFAPEASEGVGAGIAALDTDDDGGEGEVAEFCAWEPAELGGKSGEGTGVENDDQVCSEGFHGVTGGIEAECFVSE